jgi:type IV pilus assembly protein PilX
MSHSMRHALRINRRGQRGAILIIALMFLVVLTMLALTTMSGITLEERMAGQYRDLNVAFQAAEAGLRDAERDIWGAGATGYVPRTLVISGRTGFGDGTADAPNGTCSTDARTMGRGLCFANGAGANPPFPIVDLSPFSTIAVEYGRFTNATDLVNVSAQPRYIIEAIWLNILPAPKTVSLGQAGAGTTYYRIASRGFGANTRTTVTLQEMYLKPWN